MAKGDKKPIADVSKPGSTLPDSSSKPIIVSHKPMIKDPMVSEAEIGDPEIADAEMIDEEIRPPSEKPGAKTVEPLESKINNNESEAESGDQPETEIDKDGYEQTNDNSAVVDTVVSKTDDKRRKMKEDEEAAAKREEINKLIESKKYFIKVKQPKAKRNKRTLLAVILVIVFGLIGIGLAADAELIDLPVPFDFIKKIEAKSSVTQPITLDNQTSNQDKTSNDSNTAVPEGFAVYENKELGFKFAYPKEWGEVSVVDEDKNGYQYSIEFSDTDDAYGLFEKGPTAENEVGESVPVYTVAEEFEKNVANQSTKLNDGSLAKYEIITKASDRYTYGFCYYNLGISLTAKVGSNENSFTLTKNPDGKTPVNTKTAGIPACISDDTSLEKQLDKSGDDNQTFDKILDTIKAV